ncbi:hypothetical protein U5922_000965 (plasmid) [Aquicoccus sp. G2-2]|uniref:hypothetical protein n=1 Tax=Aquicoccus sp. G2-2 TaxID=3092120 RepID=UPI002ADFE73D|nr:hypothetical protein [Aquicoccus sp. G2-2]MEA1112100.1 hypothetical protein [Aquicoccus sp. G2-2]
MWRTDTRVFDVGEDIESAGDAIQKYLNGSESNRLEYPTARFEILVSKVRVLEKYCPT